MKSRNSIDGNIKVEKPVNNADTIMGRQRISSLSRYQ